MVPEDQRDLLPRIELCPEASPDSVDAAAGPAWQAFTQLNLATQTPRRHLVFVQEFLLSGDPAQVTETYDALEGGMRACVGQRTEYPDGEVGRSEPLEIPAVGEDRVAMRELVEEPGPRPATWDIRSVMVRDQGVLMAISVVEIVADDVTEPTLGDGDVEDIITLIAEKLTGGAGGLVRSGTARQHVTSPGEGSSAPKFCRPGGGVVPDLPSLRRRARAAHRRHTERYKP